MMMVLKCSLGDCALIGHIIVVVAIFDIEGSVASVVVVPIDAVFDKDSRRGQLLIFVVG